MTKFKGFPGEIIQCTAGGEWLNKSAIERRQQEIDRLGVQRDKLLKRALDAEHECREALCK